MTTLLNNYDMVLTVSQDTINNQFFLLFAEGVISNTINIAYMPSMPALQLNAIVNAPTIEMELNPVNPNQLDFNINFASGTFTYMDNTIDPINPQTADVSGWVITMLVNLEQMTITSATPPGLSVSSGAQQALSSYVGDNAFTIQALFLDFDNVNLSQVIIDTDGVQMQPSDARYPWVLTAMLQVIASLKISGNPYILGFHASSNNPAQTNPQLPALAPTSVQFISNQYNYPAGQQGPADDGLSCLCYLAMTGNQPLPYPNGKEPAFVWNPIPSSSVQARMFIDNNTFNSGYVHDLVLPVLQSALNIGGNWTQTGNSWTLDYQFTNSNDNDGHGPVIGEDWPKSIYGLTTIENFCTVALDVTNSTANQVLYNGSGYFYQKLDIYERPLDIWEHDAWTSTQLSFTFTLTISAGTDGTLLVIFNPSAGTPDQEDWKNAFVKFFDELEKVFGSTQLDQLLAINEQWADFEKFQFTRFTTNAAQGFQSLSEQLILPAPQQFYYSNIGLNSENDVVLDIGYKS
jgi:hypothetical protein